MTAHRPTEVALVTALLETEAEDVVSLAKAVIQELDASRVYRDHYMLRVGLGGGITQWVGPFDTMKQAIEGGRAVAPDYSDEQIISATHKLTPMQAIKDHMGTRAPGKTFCELCRHPLLAHDWPKAKVRGCVIGYRAGNEKSGCQCGRGFA